MAEYAIIKVSTLLEIADAIREMRKTTDELSPGSMADEILAIETGADVSGVTATSDTVFSDVYFVDSSGELKRGSVERTTLEAPTLDLDENTGSVTSTVSQPAGFITESTKSKTMQLATQSGTVITPRTDEQIAVSAGTYVTGDVKVGAITTATKAKPTISVNANGTVSASYTQTVGYVTAGTVSATNVTLSSSHDSDFKASNIKSGVTIFGVTGSYVPTFT